MRARTELGPADVDDQALAAMVATELGVPEVELLSCTVDVVDYDIEALTTAGRYWVRGTARHADGQSPYALFVKVVRSWSRSPQFQLVPEDLRALAAAGLPWRNEPLVYRSDLGSRLPAGLALPRVHLVKDLDQDSACLWLQAVDADPTPWAHPLVADAFAPELRERLLSAADALPALLDELDQAPLGTAHGDACTRNLLVPEDGRHEFVLIDFAFWCQAPLGFDLSQLLLGEVQLGERPAVQLPELEELCLAAYVRGLRDEGCDVAPEIVRRVHALVMLLFAGLSAVPLEVLFGMPAPGGPEVVRERAAAAAFVLDLVDATGT